MASRFAPRLRCAMRGAFLSLFCLLCVPPAGAKGPDNDATALITKMENLYKNAKSFQGTITMRRSGKTHVGKSLSLVGTREVRFKAPNEVYDDQHYTGTGEATRMSAQSVFYVGDGRSLYVYTPALRQYVKRPASPTVTLWQIMGRYMIIQSRCTLSMGGAAKVNGRDAYIVIAKAKIPTKFPVNVKEADKPKIIDAIKRQRPTQVFIDKHNYQLLRVAGGTDTTSDEINFVSQALNGQIADSVFTFHIPAGAKLYAPPANPADGNGLPNQIK